MGTRIVPLLAAYVAALLAARLSAEESAPPARPNLLVQANWLRLEVVGGRIVAHTTRCCQSRFEAEATSPEGSRQTLAVDWSGAGIALHYEEASHSARLIWEISPKGQHTIRHHAAAAEDPQVQYIQPASGNVCLKISGGQAQFVANDLWQLAVVHRGPFHEHLLPLLTALRDDWDLAGQVRQIEATLLQQAGTDVWELHRQWQRDVDRLASSSFAHRQAADQALRTSGPAVLAFLRQLDDRKLDGEQRRRVRAMVADLTSSRVDSPAVVADWLIRDKRVWLALLARGEFNQRVSAADHLSKLCRRTLPFDPAASPQQRQSQLAELTAKLVQP